MNPTKIEIASRRETATKKDMLLHNYEVTAESLARFDKRWKGAPTEANKVLANMYITKLNFDRIYMEAKIAHMNSQGLGLKEMESVEEVKSILDTVLDKLRKLVNEDQEHYENKEVSSEKTIHWTIKLNEIINKYVAKRNKMELGLKQKRLKKKKVL